MSLCDEMGSLSLSTSKRIQTELNEWTKLMVEGGADELGFELEELPTDISCWVVRMFGRGLYQGEVHRLQVKFGDDYPWEPPEVIFLSSPVHPHVYSNGHICLDILYSTRGGTWSPAFTIKSICLSILSMLASAEKKEQPPDNKMYVLRNMGRSPKRTRWDFHDANV